MLRYFRTMNRYRKDFNIEFTSWAYLFLHYPIFLASIHQNSQNQILKKASEHLLKNRQNKKLFNYSRLLGGKRHSIPVSFDKVGLANFKEIFLAREYAVDWIPKDITSFVDAGANKGLASLYFALSFPLKKMVLIEANPVLISEIEENVKNNFPEIDVEIINKCLSADQGQLLKFYIAKNSRDSSMVRQSDDQQEVDIESLNLKEVTSLFEDKIDLLKIDIEGAEHDLLEKEGEAFLKFKNIIAEVHGDRETCENFERGLQALGFEVSRVADSIDPYQCEIVFAQNKKEP